MASPGNQHCATCIGTLSFPICIGPALHNVRTIGDRLTTDCAGVLFRLLAVSSWPGAQIAWDSHTLACNFVKYSPILNRLSSQQQTFVNLVINNPTTP